MDALRGFKAWLF